MATVAKIRRNALGRGYVQHYFAALSLALLMLSVVAFWDNLVTDTGQKSNSDPKLVVHGLFTGAWMTVLFVQSALVDVRKIQLHREIGWWGGAIALGMALSTVYLFISVWKGWAHMDPEVKANRLLMAGWVPFVALGFYWRHRHDLHKRLVFGGTLLLLEPVLARVYDPTVVPLLNALFGEPSSGVEPSFDPFVQILFSVWTGLFLSLMAYDWLLLRRIHPVSFAALCWLGAAELLAYTT